MKIRVATSLLALGLLALSACGSSSSAASTTATSAPSATSATSVSTDTNASTGSSAATASTVPDSAATITVKAIEGVAWDKKSYAATAKDGKVTINGVNNSSIAHNLYVLDSSGKVVGDFIDLPQKGSKDSRLLPLTPGTYHLVCKVPGHANMNATLTVG